MRVQPLHSTRNTPRNTQKRLVNGQRSAIRSRRGYNPSAALHKATPSHSEWGEPILIAGGGIAGLATAVALSKVGLPVRVLESGPGLRREGAALSLWANAWRALEVLGVAGQLRTGHQLLTRVELCSSGGELLRAFDLTECDLGGTRHGGGGGPLTGPEAETGGPYETRGLMRATLLQAMYDSLPDREQIVEFGAAVREVLPDGGVGAAGGGTARVAVRLEDGRTVYGSALIGADGVASAVARHLQLPLPRYSGYCAYRGVASFPAPEPFGSGSETKSGSGSGPARLPPDTIRQIWGAGVRAGMYPLTPTSVYWFTCFNEDEAAASRAPPSPGERQRAALQSVAGWSQEGGIRDLIAATAPEDISWSRIGDRWTAGAFGRGCVTLAGDAAHPMTPNLGQGGCTALEDAVVLARKLGEVAAAAGSAPPSAAALESALRSYEYERSSRCLPLTVRASLMGLGLQSALPPVVFARNLFVRTAFSPSHFLDHTVYDCGQLDKLAP